MTVKRGGTLIWRAEHTKASEPGWQSGIATGEPGNQLRRLAL